MSSVNNYWSIVVHFLFFERPWVFDYVFVVVNYFRDNSSKVFIKFVVIRGLLGLLKPVTVSIGGWSFYIYMDIYFKQSPLQHVNFYVSIYVIIV